MKRWASGANSRVRTASPEVRTLRAKLKRLCQDVGRAFRWNAALAQEWTTRQDAAEL